ncbi:class I SAM-dependent methyltransferase, partial [Streptomyces chrestomyceticus]
MPHESAVHTQEHRGSAARTPGHRETAVYTHGHHESVLRSHTWRTAANSAAYLLDAIEPHMEILDIGCGPGTITADLAARGADRPVTRREHPPAGRGQAPAPPQGR